MAGRARTRAGTGSRSNGRKIATKEQWEAAAIHDVICPSGVTVRCRIPDLPTLMLAEDALPERLRNAAVEVLNREMRQQVQVAQAMAGGQVDMPELSFEDIAGFADLKTWLAARMVVEPEVKPEDFRAGGLLPKEDAAMLTAIATRERETDALGRRLGVVELRAMERFLLEHECHPGCEACAALRESVSDHSDRQV